MGFNLKGAGFSPYITELNSTRALAPERDEPEDWRFVAPRTELVTPHTKFK